MSSFQRENWIDSGITYQSLKAIKKKIDHKDVSFTPDEKFSDVISFTSEI